MKTATKERFEVIEFIINAIGDKGREIKIDYLSDLVEKEFPNRSKDGREFHLYFKSQINLLSENYLLTRINNTLIGLTEKGIEVYELKNGFYDYLKQMDDMKKDNRLSSKMGVASSIATILATCLAGCTLWLTYGAFPLKINLTVFGFSCFILGFVLRGLIISLLKYLWKYHK